MSIIITQNGKNAQKLDRSKFGLEDNLQQYIYDNPDSIPLYDIKEDTRLLILAREFSTNSGPIDAIGIDGEGQIYIIETKLYKNPDKRRVLAQVLDYGASLWKTEINFGYFLSTLNTQTQKKFEMNVDEKVQQFFNIDQEKTQYILNNIEKNLDEGSFKFVVLMDSLESRLKDLIIYMNQNSKFDIYGVELEYYHHQSYEIVIPKIFGAQVKKEVASTSKSNNIYSTDDFIDTFTQAGFGKQITSLLELKKKIESKQIDINGLSVDQTPNYLTFRFFFPGDNKQAIRVSAGIKRGKIDGILFWCDLAEHQNKLIEPISDCLGEKIKSLTTKSGVGLLATWNLTKYNEQKLVELFTNLSKLQ